MSEQQSCVVAPTPIMQLTTAYWDSQTFLTANRIGLFEQLALGALTSVELANKLGLQPRHTDLLLKACVGLGLLQVEQGKFSNSPLSDTYLVPGKNSYMGNAVRYSDNLYSAWGQLETALREGHPTMPPADYLGKDKEKTRHFVYGMHNRALGIGAALCHLVDLTGRRQLLDIGGGPGTYSGMFTQRYPDLRSRVLDLPEVVAIAKEILASMGAADRVELVPGDYKHTPFPQDNDVVLISGVFHRESEATCRALIAHAAESLIPGGMLIVSDVFTDQGGTSPSFAALFGLNMMISAPEGGVHEDHAVQRWMDEAGFGDLVAQPFPPPMPHRIVYGMKK